MAVSGFLLHYQIVLIIVTVFYIFPIPEYPYKICRMAIDSRVESCYNIINLDTM